MAFDSFAEPRHQRHHSLSANHPTGLQVSFRGTKIEMPLLPGTTVAAVQQAVVSVANHGANTTKTATATATALPPTNVRSVDQESWAPSDIKLVLQGKLLSDPSYDLYAALSNSTKKMLKIVATGTSKQQMQAFTKAALVAPRIKDDLSSSGRVELARRDRRGRALLQQAAVRQKPNHATGSNRYRFYKIETLPALPNEAQARRILETLANDPGILACLASHQWAVGSLAELLPDGKVGESAVSVMGLNRNQGQQILLRLRTDDFLGFRPMTKIRKVLYHELAHNEIRPHNQDFFQLMRQIEQECISMDWTQGAGLSSFPEMADAINEDSSGLVHGGTHRLGGGNDRENGAEETATDRGKMSLREHVAQAALRRMSAAEATEISEHCGCPKSHADENLFLPPENTTPSNPTSQTDDGSPHERTEKRSKE